ncbi:FAD-dependent monooxygenase [Niveispirillum sp.]|uniref:FAD-dependent oxidoreductase n=1 Tax=Niveispirillum sp. TaxID=1917217 RepID=UPI001B5D6052|nr:FAD-dependent monooxygenase [Niveispirillum sp.]MBP7335587.1 FAD-dependent monooxygenase [Niveispirillum sp.]
MQASQRPIIIVGAGPVGLMTAHLLARQGIASTVLEQDAAISQDLRASTFHPPTLDMLDGEGLAAPLIAQGRLCPTWQIRMHDTHERAVFDLSVLKNDTAHPYRLQCEQWRLCALLVERLQDEPLVTLRFSTRLTGLEQDGDSVTAQVETPEGTERLQAPFLVGADGARSVVRGLIGLEFDGVTYPETTILATTEFPFEEHLPGLSNVNYVWKQDGTFSLLRLRDRWRCSLYPDPEMPIEEALLPANIDRKMQEIVPRDTAYEIGEARAYRVHMRITRDYRNGRVVLAGDAAHINSPSGGMGMNGGLHDAFNLTATLGEILRGGSLDLLDRYTRQRRPIAEAEVLAQADRNRSRMQERDPAKRRVIMDDLLRIIGNPESARAYLLRSSMIEALRKSAQIQ